MPSGEGTSTSHERIQTTRRDARLAQPPKPVIWEPGGRGRRDREEPPGGADQSQRDPRLGRTLRFTAGLSDVTDAVGAVGFASQSAGREGCELSLPPPPRLSFLFYPS